MLSKLFTIFLFCNSITAIEIIQVDFFKKTVSVDSKSNSVFEIEISGVSYSSQNTILAPNLNRNQGYVMLRLANQARRFLCWGSKYKYSQAVKEAEKNGLWHGGCLGVSLSWRPNIISLNQHYRGMPINSAHHFLWQFSIDRGQELVVPEKAKEKAQKERRTYFYSDLPINVKNQAMVYDSMGRALDRTRLRPKKLYIYRFNEKTYFVWKRQ